MTEYIRRLCMQCLFRYPSTIDFKFEVGKLRQIEKMWAIALFRPTQKIKPSNIRKCNDLRLLISTTWKLTVGCYGVANSQFDTRKYIKRYFRGEVKRVTNRDQNINATDFIWYEMWRMIFFCFVERQIKQSSPHLSVKCISKWTRQLLLGKSIISLF